MALLALDLLFDFAPDMTNLTVLMIRTQDHTHTHTHTLSLVVGQKNGAVYVTLPMQEKG